MRPAFSGVRITFPRSGSGRPTLMLYRGSPGIADSRHKRSAPLPSVMIKGAEGQRRHPGSGIRMTVHHAEVGSRSASRRIEAMREPRAHGFLVGAEGDGRRIFPRYPCELLRPPSFTVCEAQLPASERSRWKALLRIIGNNREQGFPYRGECGRKRHWGKP